MPKTWYSRRFFSTMTRKIQVRKSLVLSFIYNYHKRCCHGQEITHWKAMLQAHALPAQVVIFTSAEPSAAPLSHKIPVQRPQLPELKQKHPNSLHIYQLVPSRAHRPSFSRTTPRVRHAQSTGAAAMQPPQARPSPAAPTFSLTAW